MRLTKVQVTNFRSIFGTRMDIDLTTGVNAVIGPNNCGKSNLLRALALAMQEDHPFDRLSDLPPIGPATRAQVVCHFQVGTTSPEETLLQRVREAEQALSGNQKTYADDRIVRFAVSRSGTRRAEYFQTKALSGSKQPETEAQKEAARKAVAQLRSTCRFVYVKSGDSLESLLQGRFREMLRTVLQEHQRTEYGLAETARDGYVQALRQDLLSMLETGVVSQVSQLFPEVAAVELQPQITSIEESLLGVDVRLTDLVQTGLADKGTGVRGAVLIAMLRYMADYGRRSVVFAVEEPESFLHPAAQEQLRDDLEALSKNANVTMLVTTHSPFIPSRKSDAQLVALSKDASGSTRVAGSAAGDAERTALVLSLFRHAAQPELLERAAKADARGLLVLEGYTDAAYLRLAARCLGRESVLDGIELIYEEGAKKAARRGILLKDELPSTPMMVLFDDDTDGHAAHTRLKNDFNFKPGVDILMYSAILAQRLNGQPVEAEDLFATALIEGFLKEKGSNMYTAMVKRNKAWGPDWATERHYDLTKEAKGLLPKWLEKKCKPQHLSRWGLLLDIIEKRFP